MLDRGFPALSRARLSPLRDGSIAPVTTVIAPAGFGKTTLLKLWINDGPFASYDVKSIRCQRQVPESPDTEEVSAGLQFPSPRAGSQVWGGKERVLGPGPEAHHGSIAVERSVKNPANPSGVWGSRLDSVSQLASQFPVTGNPDSEHANAVEGLAPGLTVGRDFAERERTFWRQVCEALGVAPGASGEEAARAGAASLRRPTMLVIDDYQRATTPHLDLALVDLVMDSEFLSITVAGRYVSVLEGPLASAIVPLMRIPADDLAFTNQEIRRLAVAQLGQGVDVPSAVGRLSHGWPRVVSALLQASASGVNDSELLDLFSLMIRQQLRLIRHPLGKRVLYQVVICKQIAAEQLADVCNEPLEEVEDALRELSAQGLVTGKLGKSGIRFSSRLPALVFLERDALRELGEATVRQLRVQHYLDLSSEDPDEAVTRLIELREYEVAEQVLLANFLSAMEPSETFIDVVTRIPPADLKNHLVLSLILPLIDMANPKTSGLELERSYARLHQLVARHLSRGSREEIIVSLAALSTAHRIRGSAVDAMKTAKELDERLRHSDRRTLDRLGNSLPVFHSVVSFTALIHGDRDLAERAYMDCLQSALRLGDISGQIRGWSGLALVAAMSARVDEARRRVRKAEELVVSSRISGPPMSAYSRETTRVLLALEDRAPEELKALIKPLSQVLEGMEQAGILVYAEVQMKRITDGPAAALQLLNERAGEIKGTARGTPYLMAELSVLRANLLIYLGSFHGAVRTLNPVVSRLRTAEMARARLELFKGSYKQSLSMAQEVLEHAVPVRVLDQARAIAAVSAWQLSDLPQARRFALDLEESLSQNGGTNVLSTVPYDLLNELLKRLAAEEKLSDDPIARAQVGRLRKELRALPGNLRARQLDPLSSAELRTLYALNTNSTREKVAAELQISQNTVKFHLRGIYRKLGVTSRAEALEKAVFLGLLDA